MITNGNAWSLVFGSAVGALAAALLAVGCGKEDESRFCDSSGCYVCDGYGCSRTSAAPPANPLTDAGPSLSPTTDAAPLLPDAGGGVDGAAAASACRYSSECGTNLVCVDSQCTVACDSTHPCAATATCESGYCRPKSSGTAACSSDVTCGAGNYCKEGACQLDTRPKPNCESDAQCGTGQICAGGFCKYRCDSDLDCRRTDARIPYCAADKVCRSESEAYPQCTKSTDCANGKSCVANQCK
jgi:hypothetical protein